jgi:hypothetical protein
MREIELTMRRLLSVWWLLMWRGFLGAGILGSVASGIAGFAVGVAGHPENGATVGYYAGMAVSPFWGLLVIQMALTKKYHGFRIALLSTETT